MNPIYTIRNKIKELLSAKEVAQGCIIRLMLYPNTVKPCLLSCEIGVEKPDPMAFELLLKELNLAASQIVFIDDKCENVEAAKMLGLDAILFESEEQLRKDLASRKLYLKGKIL